MKNCLLLTACCLLLATACSKDNNNDTGSDEPQVEPSLEVSTSSISATAAASNYSIAVTSNTAWKATINALWCTLTNATGTGNGTVTVNVTENPAGRGARSATITLAAGTLTRQVSITQEAGAPEEEPEVLTVSPPTIDVTDVAASYTITVTSNMEWTAEVNSEATWCTLTNATGTGNGTVTVNVEDNPDEGSRSATITFTAGMFTRQVSVTQARVPQLEKSDTTGWTVPYASADNNWWGNGGPDVLIDGSYDTDHFWHAGASNDTPPYTVIIDMQTPRTVARVVTFRREGGDTKSVEYYVSDSADGPWTELVKGAYESPQADHTLTLDAPTPQTGRYLKLICPDSNRDTFVAIHEIDVYELK
jgi:hypothetical protein